MARILIIDDDVSLRRTIRRMLASTGHEIVEAADGAQGVELVRAAGADLVITDLIMPDQDGIETIQLLRDGWPGIKILAISGGGLLDPADRLVDAELLGADAALSKPFEIAELREKVAELL